MKQEAQAGYKDTLPQRERVKHWTRSPSEVVQLLFIELFKTGQTGSQEIWSELRAVSALSKKLE